jgi:hypothetical protein
MSKQSEFDLDHKRKKLMKNDAKPRDPLKEFAKEPKVTKKVKEQPKEKDFSKFQENKIPLNQEEIEKLLIGYDDIPRNEWINIKPKSHIRYEKIDGSWARGGFVKNHFQKDGLNCIYLENNLGNNATGWAIVFNNISKIWKRRTTDDVKIQTIEQKIQHTHMDTLSIESRMDLLESDVRSIKNDIQNILKWIKSKSSTSQQKSYLQATSNNTSPAHVVLP